MHVVGFGVDSISYISQFSDVNQGDGETLQEIKYKLLFVDTDLCVVLISLQPALKYPALFPPGSLFER